MQKYLALTTINANDPLPRLGAKVERMVKPLLNTLAGEIRRFEQRDHTPSVVRMDTINQDLGKLEDRVAAHTTGPKTIYKHVLIEGTVIGRRTSSRDAYQRIPKLAEKPAVAPEAVAEGLGKRRRALLSDAAFEAEKRDPYMTTEVHRQWMREHTLEGTFSSAANTRTFLTHLLRVGGVSDTLSTIRHRLCKGLAQATEEGLI